MEKTPRQIEDEFMLTSISMLRHGEQLPPQLLQDHQLRLSYAQEFFDRWGVTLEQTLTMSQEEFIAWIDLALQ